MIDQIDFRQDIRRELSFKNPKICNDLANCPHIGMLMLIGKLVGFGSKCIDSSQHDYRSFQMANRLLENFYHTTVTVLVPHNEDSHAFVEHIRDEALYLSKFFDNDENGLCGKAKELIQLLDDQSESLTYKESDDLKKCWLEFTIQLFKEKIPTIISKVS